jgi:hypothetical protein
MVADRAYYKDNFEQRTIVWGCSLLGKFTYENAELIFDDSPAPLKAGSEEYM